MGEKLAMGVVSSWVQPKNDVNSIVSGRPDLGAYEEPCGHHLVRGVGCELPALGSVTQKDRGHLRTL